MELKKGTRLKNRYEITTIIGRGGFGCTYKAIDHLLNRFVAIKSSEASLSHEAKILKALENVPHICHIYEYFIENKQHYIVMRYVEGKNLSLYRQENGGTVSIDFLKQCLPSLIITLDQMHERGIIHRDISPGNMIVTDENILYLIDFGAATALKDTSLKNKFKFAHKGLDAPEHLDESSQGTWTDVYSLCSSIVYLLTGEGLPACENRLMSDPLPELLVKMPINGRMQNALLRGLAIDPTRRYRSVISFSESFLGEDVNRTDIEKSYSVHYHARTDIGKRPVNQDNYMVDKLFAYAGEDCEIKGNIECEKDAIHIVAVADGVAGVLHGELASKAAIQAVSHFVDYYRYNDGLLQNLLEELLNQLNEKILILSKKIGKTATTISIFAWRNNEFCVANIGDSPVYRLRGRKLNCLSEIQTIANDMLSNGMIPTSKDLHSLSNYLGKPNTSGESMAHITTGRWEKGDIYMICSDGISGISSDEQKSKWMKQDGDKAIKNIFKHAHKHDSMDNCTSIILKF